MSSEWVQNREFHVEEPQLSIHNSPVSDVRGGVIWHTCTHKFCQPGFQIYVQIPPSSNLSYQYQ